MFSLVLGFAAVWHIWWLAIVGLVGVVATVIGYSFRKNDGFYHPGRHGRGDRRANAAESPVRPQVRELNWR